MEESKLTQEQGIRKIELLLQNLSKEVSLEFFKLYPTDQGKVYVEVPRSSLTCVTDVVQETFPPEETDQKKLHWEKRRCIGVSTSSQSQGCYLR